ncbi:Insulinase (Peptidase M16) [Apophysomyces ossiformis]|uniref:Insulinase (Peptidase M16) n=1 Tax=Apophysomyces ossiformis TaxID=679940 RepID=A0A8H7BH87_9FUNG|nr:Insulinase (Peptidase M16) [Apophysomyces ossiformis]
MIARSSDAEWSSSQDESFHIYTKPLEKPAIDEREYRLLRLNNQLEVLLISDPETDRASAALDVHVGNLSDPDHLQGLAHFCEHLLFMGTKKYPKENDYCSYLAEHSGYANAFTAAENTNYYFEVGHQWLEGALDRFSRFFIDPLFSSGCTERELRAVDSEHKKNIQSDSWRIAQVEKSLSHPEHPWRHFGTGNLETLMHNPKRLGLDIREELLKFHETYYSANLMKLCVLGQESLDQLTAWVVEKFSDVPNKDLKVPMSKGHPLSPSELMTQIFIKSIKDNRTIDITFPFPDQTPYFKSRPAHYISHLIGHEGPGSILSHLKRKGWATSLSAGSYDGGIGFAFFHVNIDLTEEGLDRYEDVVVSVFEYVEMLKQMGVKKWIFEEDQSLSAISFKFTERYGPSQYTSMLSQEMQSNYPPQWILSGWCLTREYDPELIQQHLNLLRPDNFRLTLSSPEFSSDIKCSQIEQWYGTEYELLPVSVELRKRLDALQLNDAFKLPPINEFIPNNVDYSKGLVDKRQDKPDLIQETSTMRLWHKKDDTFWMPKTNTWIFFRNPLVTATPRNEAITSLYIDLLSDSLTEYSYNADVAGLSYYMSHRSNGIMLSVGGYSDKLPLLLEKVIHRMKYLRVEPERFNIIKDQARRDNKNFSLEAPYQHAQYYLSYMIREKMWTYDDWATELEDIHLQDVVSFYPSILSHLHIEALVHGNLKQDQAIKMLRMVEDILTPRPLIPSQLVGNRTISLPEGKSYVYRLSVRDKDELNSAIEYYCQVCNMSDISLRTRLSLVAQIAQEPCFNQLRTKEQLGYLVFSGVRRHFGTLGLRFIIQSERSTVYLENRIEEFIDTLREVIVNLSEEDYAAQINSLIADKLEKFKNMGQEGLKYWNDIYSGCYEFDAVAKDVKELRQTRKADLLEFFNTFIHPSSTKFRKLSIHIQSQKASNATTIENNGSSDSNCKRNHAELAKDTILITDAVSFKHQMALSSAPVPFFLFSRI